MVQFRGPRSSIDSEKIVLGSVILDNRKFRRLSHVLTPGAFYSEVNRNIFLAMISLQCGPLDLLTLGEYSGSHPNQGITLAYLAELFDNVPENLTTQEYWENVKSIGESSFVRQLAWIVTGVAADAHNETDATAQELIAYTSEMIASLKSRYEQYETFFKEAFQHEMGIEGKVQ